MILTYFSRSLLDLNCQIWAKRCLCALYLMNWLADFNQLCMDIILGHVEELVRFWWPWHNFQGHSCMTEIATIDWFGRWGTSVSLKTLLYLCFIMPLLQKSDWKPSCLQDKSKSIFEVWCADCEGCVFSSPEPKAHRWAFSIYISRYPSSTFSNNISSKAMKPVLTKFHI